MIFQTNKYIFELAWGWPWLTITKKWDYKNPTSRSYVVKRGIDLTTYD